MSAEIKLVLKSFLWVAAVSLVLVIGINYFPMEVEGLSFWGSLYFSIRLFILEHDISHFPTHAPLIFAYFFAPIVSLSTLGTVLSYVYRFSPVFLSQFKKNHVIVCGVGRKGKLLFALIKEQGFDVMGIDNGQPEGFEDFISRQNASMVFGNFLSGKILARAGFARARNMVFASSDDLLNLEGAIGVYDKLGGESAENPMTIWVHISNDRLSEATQAVMRMSGKIKIRFFDTFAIAADKIVKNYFPVNQRKGIDKITILGFGEFGHDLMKALVKDAGKNEKWEIDVVDIRDRKKEVFNLAEELKITCKTKFTQADILDVQFEESLTRVVFLCTDDDTRNLSTAILLSRNHKGALIYVRMTMWPLAAVKEHFGNGNKIQFININDLVREGIRDIKYML